MFALPLTAPLHDSLVGHWFGRFVSRPAQAGGGEVAAGGVAGLVADDGAQGEDGIPDLAQRVREVGEW